MALLAALLAREVRALLGEVLENQALAEGVAWVVALGAPLIHYAGLIFTEAPAALLLVFAFRRARQARESGSASSLLLGPVLGFLPWLNVRYAPLAVLLAPYVSWQGVRARAAGGLLAPPGKGCLSRRGRHPFSIAIGEKECLSCWGRNPFP